MPVPKTSFMSFKIFVLILSVLLTLSISAFSQTQFDPQSEGNMIKATYSEGNLVTVLGKDLTYPVEASASGSQGKVLFVVTIDENGDLTSVKTKEKISDNLYSQAEEAIARLTGKWQPTQINGKAMARDYLLVFSYKIYYNAVPMDYFATAAKFEDKGKLKKAIDTYDEAIKENPYEPTFYKMRASIKKANEDADGAKEDEAMAEKMMMEVLAVIQIAQTQSIR